MTLLSVRALKVHFRTRRGVVRAVDGVSFDIAPGETLGLVGESGCGKSTLGRAVMRLIEPSSGEIELDGQNITHLRGNALRAIRSKAQMVFQDPYASFNPRRRIGEIVAMPLFVNGVGTKAERRERVRWLLDRVGIGDEAIGKYPHEFSGGQRQRIGIARALALNPRLIICDESVSALDVSVRAQILNLLNDLQAEFGLSYLFISHDLSVVEMVSDRVAVMYLGRLVELADGMSLWSRPLHPYSQALISAIPVPDPSASRAQRIRLQGTPPSAVAPPSGCRFHPRCPFAEPRCANEVPELREVAPAHLVACHLAERVTPQALQEHGML